ncbi:MAG: diadenylate cyclase CdaA [Clostridiales bacterium]|nr:diadenylate cyclase CdaA [Clostridiales bacterium]
MKEFFVRIYESMADNPAACVIDVVLTALLIYGIIVFLKKNNAVKLVAYLLPLVFAGIVLSSDMVGLTVIGTVLSYSLILAIIAIVLLFPQESRRGIMKLASPKEEHDVYITENDITDDQLHETISHIVRAAQNMSKKNVGALIVISTHSMPEHILDSGTELDAVLSCALLESIFNTKAPLHDGAVFVRGNRIIAAGCFLPLSQSNSIDKELGTRHRAAIGVTESYNVLAIIVSEETGVISVAHHGNITRYYDSQMLTDQLEQVYGLKAVSAKKKTKRSLRSDK